MTKVVIHSVDCYDDQAEAEPIEFETEHADDYIEVRERETGLYDRTVRIEVREDKSIGVLIYGANKDEPLHVLIPEEGFPIIHDTPSS